MNGKNDDEGGFVVPEEIAGELEKLSSGSRFDPKNKECRYVLTPRGLGWYWGNDDPGGSPQQFAVQVKGTGTFMFKADELNEIIMSEKVTITSRSDRRKKEKEEFTADDQQMVLFN